MTLPAPPKRRRPGHKAKGSRALALNPRSLGIDRRSLEGLSAGDRLERYVRARELAAARPDSPTRSRVIARLTELIGDTGRTLERDQSRRTCEQCGGSGWVPSPERPLEVVRCSHGGEVAPLV